MTTPRKHKHADMIRQWLNDDSLGVEYLGNKGWGLVTGNPTWDENVKYRFKPRMITVNGMEFPEPMRVAPDIGADYWIPSIDLNHLGNVIVRTWQPNSDCHQRLQRGICHTTQAAAEAHARALIALTELQQISTGPMPIGDVASMVAKFEGIKS